MVRGCEKRIYYVKNPDSEIFDEAYLVLRPRDGRRSASPREIELEAMRIVRGVSVSSPPPPPVRHDVGRLKAFLAGALLSAAVIGIASTVLCLLL